MLDYRIPENRREFFLKYLAFGLRSTDCDAALGMLNYIFERQELNLEQRMLVSWYYANTYNLPTAYLFYNEFPDYEGVDLGRLTRWNNENYKRLRYNTDLKYNKGFLPQMFESYRTSVGGSQVSFYKKLCGSSNPKENYETLKKFIDKNFYKFGRYTCWFFAQTLRECVGIPLEPTDLIFGHSGSESHTNGMCRVIGRDQWLTKHHDDSGKKIKTPFKYTPDIVNYLQRKADGLLTEFHERYPDLKCDYFLLETYLCAFQKLFRRKNGRYAGFYLDRQAEEIRQVENDGWDSVDWQILWDYRRECLHPELIYPGKIRVEKMREFLDTGWLQELQFFEDLR